MAPVPQFSVHLGPTVEAHNCLVQLSESEIKRFEGMRNYIEKRAKLDLEYAEKVNKLHNVVKVDVNTSEDDGFLERAWKTFVNETENKAIMMMQMSKELQMIVLPKLDKIISSKKELLRRYKLDRSRSDLDFSCSKDEIKRLSDVYRQSLKDSSKFREKLDEVSNKGRGDKEWKKSKERLDKSCLKLHTTHNDYILALRVANEHQLQYNGNVAPYMLDSMQELLEGYIGEMKDVMTLIFENTNWCKDDFVDSAKSIHNSIRLLDHTQEYTKFMEKNKRQVLPAIPFFFEETLVADDKSSNGLVPDEMALNDLTHEQLKYKMKTLEQQMETLTSELKLKEDALSRVEGDISELTNMNKTDASNSFSILEKKCQLHHIKRELNDLHCKESLAKVQHDHITEMITQLGDGPPPAYIELVQPSNGKVDIDRKDRAKSLNIEETRKKKTKDRHSLFVGKKSKSSSSSISELPSPASTSHDDHDGFQSDNSLGDYEDPVEENPLHSEPWFHGSIDRRAAERLLKQDGDFLIREKSDGSGTFVVSTLCKGMHKHFLLNKTEDGCYKFESEAFATVRELINHHHRNCVPIKSQDHVLIVNPVRPAFTKGDKFSFQSSNVRLDVKLGNGHFGDVYKGMVIKSKLAVAIKTCKEGVDAIKKKQFLEEAEIMKPYDHPNVVKLIGICNDQEPFMILMELMPYGDLSNFLKKRGITLGMKELLQLGNDAARGMAYLESRSTIHRDLAARNVLVGENYIAKISDFGMSREEDDEGIYTINTTKEIPIKWTAPEVWHYSQYTSKSDVWSFGILLWEIFSMGNVPYPGWNNKRTREMVEKGYRMPMPNGTPLRVYEIMNRCWEYDASYRPNFSEIEKEMDEVSK